MRILIAFYEINNFGGILNNQEALYKGLLELGHTVENVCLFWKSSVKPGTSAKETEESAFGGHMDYEVGWTRMPRMAYKGAENIQRWKDYASKFDLIIWQIPVPSKEKGNIGNLDWIELYDIPVKQIVYVHDGNLLKGYPHIYQVVEKLTGAIGVHPCAYNSLAKLPLPRAMAFSPQMNIKERIAAANAAKKRRDGWFSLQTFKAWKHVDDIVRAVPYMGNYPKILAGCGIHYYYMTSQDKLRPEYIVSRDRDPDVSAEFIGERIWNLALTRGMKYKSWVTSERREKILHKSAALIDPSWALNYARIGDHFNRVVIDGIIGGAVPIARNLGVATNEEGRGELFKPNENYFMIPYNTTPREFAAHVNEFLHPMNKQTRERMVEDARTHLVPHFDYRKTAQAFIDLANGRPAGYKSQLPEVSKGKYNRKAAFASRALIEEFFNGNPSKEGFF